jgi:hypothetical protein
VGDAPVEARPRLRARPERIAALISLKTKIL